MANNQVKVLYNEIPFSDPDWPRWQGPEQWHDRTEADWPVAGQNGIHCDVYWRFPATRIANATAGSYNWSWFDARVNEAIARKQKFHFGIMTLFPDRDSTNAGAIVFPDGALSCFPLHLHTSMQAEGTNKDWIYTADDGTRFWVPNINSTPYKAWWLTFNQAIQAHITAMGWDKVIGCIDSRGWGSWGECHHHPYAPNNDVTVGWINSGDPIMQARMPSTASLKTIIDHTCTAYPNKQIQIMFSQFDAHWLRNTWNSPELCEYALLKTNTMGKLGWRRDNLGAEDGYMKDYAEFNNRGFSVFPAGSGPTQGFKVPILNRWQEAPVTAEPPGWNPGDYWDLLRQVNLHRYSSFGNGNSGAANSQNIITNTTVANRFREAMKRAGSRIKMADAEMTYVPGTLTLKINWQNTGLTPLYKYDSPVVVLEILNSAGTVVTTKNSTMDLKLFLPSSTPTLHTDNFTGTTLPNATYTGRIYIKDANGYRDNYKMAIQGADTLNRVSAGTLVVAATPVPGPGPVVNAGNNQQIQLVQGQTLAQATLNATATDDVSIVSTLWAKFSGPGNPTIVSPTGLVTSVTGLPVGTHVFRFTAWDNDDLSTSDDVSIVVLAAPPIVIPPDPPTVPLTVKQVQLFAKVTMSNGSSQTVDVVANPPAPIATQPLPTSPVTPQT